MAQSLVGQPPATSFDRGVTHFTWLMIYFMAVMVPLVFLIAGITPKEVDGRAATRLEGCILLRDNGGRGPYAGDAADDRLASAFPGVIGMSRKKVIVKRLNSIQNLARWTCFAPTRPARLRWIG